MELQELKNRVTAQFAAPEFDKNRFAAGLIAQGLEFTEIAARVSEAQKEFAAKNPAPACTIDLIKDFISSNYAQEYKTLCNCDVDEADGLYYNLEAGALTSCKLSDEATANQKVTAVLSYRYVIEHRNIIARLQAEKRAVWSEGLYRVIRGAKGLNMDLEAVISEISCYWNIIDEADTKTMLHLKCNLNKMWGRINDANDAILLTSRNSAAWNKAISKRNNFMKQAASLQKLIDEH